MKRLAAVVIAALTLTACATATPYAPASRDTAGRGYSELRIEPDRWRVSFAGNSETPRQTVESYMLFRSAEITVQNGFDWFETADRNTERQTTFVTSPDPWYGGYGPYWHPYWRGYYGGRGWGPAFGPNFDVTQVTRFEASTEIILHHGPKPAGNPRAFDAHEVMANLGAHVVRPGAK